MFAERPWVPACRSFQTRKPRVTNFSAALMNGPPVGLRQRLLLCGHPGWLFERRPRLHLRLHLQGPRHLGSRGLGGILAGTGADPTGDCYNICRIRASRAVDPESAES